MEPLKLCVYCNKKLTGRKQKYCNELCQFRLLSIQNDKPGKFSVSQHLRMSRAGKKQAAGKIGVRYN
jgi:hypothetical protein